MLWRGCFPFCRLWPVVYGSATANSSGYGLRAGRIFFSQWPHTQRLKPAAPSISGCSGRISAGGAAVADGEVALLLQGQTHAVRLADEWLEKVFLI